VKGSKSEAIREILFSEPKLLPAEIRDRLAEQGIQVDTHLIKVVRAKFRKDLPEIERKWIEEFFRFDNALENSFRRRRKAYVQLIFESFRGHEPFPPIPKDPSYPFVKRSREAEEEREADFRAWIVTQHYFEATQAPKHDESIGDYQEPQGLPLPPDDIDYLASILMLVIFGKVPDKQILRYVWSFAKSG
jgi:hypothetical protein